MNEFLNKISSYNIFNYLFPGVILTVILKSISEYDLIQDNILVGAFLYYFIGLVVSRIGSLIIEPILKKIKFVVFEDYPDYIAASKIDATIETLSEVNNMYRTICSMLFLTVVIKIYEWLLTKIYWLEGYSSYFLFAFLFTLFLFSYRKQTNYISQRIRKNLE